MRVKMVLLGVLAAVMMVCSGAAFAADAGKAAEPGKAVATEKAAKKTAKKTQVLYVCNCGADCKCNTVSTKPGKCTCGKKMVPMHVLKIEKDEALLCQCGKGCTCKLNDTDPTKCGCGKPVKRVSLKGMYICACGDACDCNTISKKPGKCRCGKDLKKVE